MTDTEMIKLCAQAMGLKHKVQDGHVWQQSSYSKRSWSGYNPLMDDAAAMALVKRLKLWIQPPRQGHLSAPPSGEWFVDHSVRGDSRNQDLNRAIVECVAKMVAARTRVTTE